MAGQPGKQELKAADASATAPPAEVRADQLVRLVSRGAVRWRRLTMLQSAGLAVAALLAYLWLVFIIDNVLHLPGWGRFLAGGVFFIAVVWLAWRLVCSWRRLHLTDEEAALAIERQTPGGVQNRLINSIQFARDGKLPVEVGSAVVRENCLALESIPLREPKRARPALACAGAAALVVAAGVVFWGIRPELFANAAARILLPFSKIDPIYRTTLSVQPGDTRALRGQHVTITVSIKGQLPPNLVVMRSGTDARTVIPVKAGSSRVRYTFKAVEATTSYAVRGGDFLTPWYRIDVPVMAQLSMIKATLNYPEYTKCPPQLVENTNGSLEALAGTRAACTFVLDHPADSAALLLVTDEAGGGEDRKTRGLEDGKRAELKKIRPREFAGEIVFDNVAGYQLETRRSQTPDYRSNTCQLRVLADQAPQLALTGLGDREEVAVDAVLTIGISAKDDYGLRKAGIFQRIAPRAIEAGSLKETAEAGQQPDDWQPAREWDVPEQRRLFRGEHSLQIVSLGLAEGDEFEIVPRAIDTDPGKAGAWTTGGGRRMLVGGEGVALQVLYEKILAGEAAIRRVIDGQRQAADQVTPWIQKLDPASGTDWSNKGQLDALTAAITGQAAQQETLHQQTGAVARELVRQAGNLRISLGMLADTEMVRSVRILEAAPKRENAQEMRAALFDAQQTQQRTERSLQEILDEYVRFRQDWELANMMPLLKMLADRQARMSDESRTLAADVLARSMLRRQTKLIQLTGLMQTAFAGMSERTDTAGPVMAEAFGVAAKAFDSSGVKDHMQAAIGHLEAGKGNDASAEQKLAGAALNAIYLKLKDAQAEAARQLMALLKQQLEDQQKIRNLRPGSSNQVLKLNEDELNITDIVRMQKLADENRKKTSPGSKKSDRLFDEEMLKIATPPDSGGRQDCDAVSLAKTPMGYESFPAFSDQTPNAVIPPIQEEFKDLVGDLLDELEELMEDYDTYNLNATLNLNDPGDVAKMAGPFSSTAASAFTGNQKAPPHDFGGASRMGRQGARAHGAAVGDVSINRRGRDEALESQERVPDQQGVAREIKSGDPQTDFATGVGGKRVESDDPSFFNTKNAGHWTDDIANRMTTPKALHLMVERQGGPAIDPRVAQMLRALESNQRQVIQRINALKKQLNNLYLPTDQVDELSRQLAANLDRLKDAPDADVFRRQQETLAKLRSAVMTAGQAASDFQPSLPREQAIRGPILDEPQPSPMPQYDEAVKCYFEKLSDL
ncbi:MAG TPA: hypothetical protein VM223_21300 [Planctomycetota bacterium]|nr:hypothetical protein [Planctomycetota bacterium]